MRGTLKWFNRVKGYGFINGEDGQDYFVHFSQIMESKQDRDMIRDGDALDFNPETGDRGLKAIGVRIARGG